VFQVRSGNPDHAPRTYTVEPHKRLSGSWPLASIGAAGYDLSVYGPNGFLRSFKGEVSGGSHIDVKAKVDGSSVAISLTLANRGVQSVAIHVLDLYAGTRYEIELDARESISRRWSLGRYFGWYDLVITAEGDSRFTQELAGHVETGRDSISDPAMGRVRLVD
jgi:phospholipase C